MGNKRITVMLCAIGMWILPAHGQSAAMTRRDVAAALSEHQYAQALRLLAPMLRASPKDASLWTLRGIALDGQGHTQESLSSFNHALVLDGSFLPALEGAAQSTYLHGDPRALHYVEKLLAHAPENEIANAMAGALTYQSHECGRSITYYERSGEQVYRDHRAVDEFADCLLKQQQTQQAITVLSNAVKLYPESVQFRYNLAVAELQDNQPDRAVEILSPLSSVKDADLLNLLALAYEQAKRPDDAFRVLENAIEVNPQDETNYLDLAILCLEHNQEQRSVLAASAGIARIPKAASLYLIRGVAYAQLANYDKAENDFTTAAEIEPNQPHSTIAMSLLYSDRNQLDKEKALLVRQLEITPNDAVTNYMLADLLIRSGALPHQPDFEKALMHLKRSLAAKPNSIEAQILMAKLLTQDGSYTEALSHIEVALKADPDNQSALNRKFVLLHKLHRNEEAGQILSRLKTVLNDDLKRENAANSKVRVEAKPATN
jgi:tetratricopeptide (TPR) repeat protein